SESEAPLEPFAWKDGGALTHERLLELAGAEEGTAVEETDLATLLRTVPPEDKAMFDKLAKVLQAQLSNLKVDKVGNEADRVVYLVGKTKAGQWAGLKTTVVET